MKSYENALRNECGYEGAQPYVFFFLGCEHNQLVPNSYWDWSIDSDFPNL